MKYFVLFIAIFMGACTASIKPEAQNIKTISASEKTNCQFLGVIGASHGSGPNKPQSALNKAINQVHKKGGDSLYIISTSDNWAEGASISGEAYKCN